MKNSLSQTHERAALQTPSGLLGLLHRATKAVARHNRGKGHLHHAKTRVLATVAEHGPMSQSDLLAVLGVRPSPLSEVIGKLEQEGLIRKEKSAADKRAVLLSLTAQGTVMARQEAVNRLAYAETVFASFNDPERQELARLLAKLITVVEHGQCIGGRDDPVRRSSRCAALAPYAESLSGPPSRFTQAIRAKTA